MLHNNITIFDEVQQAHFEACNFEKNSQNFQLKFFCTSLWVCLLCADQQVFFHEQYWSRSPQKLNMGQN